MKRKFLSSIVVFLLGISVMFFLVRQCNAQLPWMQNPLVGQPAPDFTLSSSDGTKVNLKDYQGEKNAIIFFWATWCPHCRETLQELNRNSSTIESKGIKLVLVDVGESERDVRSYISKHKINTPVLLDEESELTDPYGIIGVPTFVFVDGQGIVKAVKHSLPENYEELFSIPKAAQN